MEMIKFMRMNIKRRLAACYRTEQWLQELAATHERSCREEMKEKLTVASVLCGFLAVLAMLCGIIL